MNTAMKYALPEGGAAGTKAIWVGRILSALAIAFFVMDGVMKLIQPQVVIDATRQIGWPEKSLMQVFSSWYVMESAPAFLPNPVALSS
jgi:hypothetical protein